MSKYKELQIENIADQNIITVIERQNDDGSISYIPADESNSDYQRYLGWLENPDAEEGGTL